MRTKQTMLKFVLAMTALAITTCTLLASDLILESSRVEIKDEANIPAPEAGVLVKFTVREGTRVTAGDVLGVIDDREAQSALAIAEYGMKAALARALNKVEERYARKASEVAKADWEKALAANARNKNAISEIEIMQKQLSYEKAELQIEKAFEDQKLAELDFYVKKAEKDASQMAVDRRTITAPFAGEVTKTSRHEDEWVNPGDPILKLVRFDKLYVENWVDAAHYDHAEMLGRKVTVEVYRARNRKATVTGTIVYASPELQSNNLYRIRAEVDNRMEDNFWLVLPGMLSTMTVHLEESADLPQSSLPEVANN